MYIPTYPLCPAPHLLLVSVCSFTITRHLPTLPLSPVLGQSHAVEAHISSKGTQSHPLHMWLHGPNHHLSLLTAQSLAVDPQSLNLDTVQDADIVTVTDIADTNKPRHTASLQYNIQALVQALHSFTFKTLNRFEELNVSRAFKNSSLSYNKIIISHYSAH